MLKIEDIKQMSLEEIEKELTKNRHELLKSKIEVHSNQSQKTSRLKELRTDIARLETVKTELINKAK